MMTEPFRPAPHAVAHPVLDGHRPVDALWFPHGWLDESTRQRLLLAAWRPGSRAHRFPDGDLLHYPQPVWTDCGAVRGWPLQRVAGTLCSAAIEPADLAGQPFADAWLAVGGVLTPLRLSEALALDPSAWLVVGNTLVETFDLRPREQERTLAIPAARDLRQVLGPKVPGAASEDSQRFMQALQQRGAAADGLGATQARAAARHGPALPTPAPIGARARRMAWIVALAAGVFAAYTLWPPESAPGDEWTLTTLIVPVALFWLLRGWWRAMQPSQPGHPGQTLHAKATHGGGRGSAQLGEQAAPRGLAGIRSRLAKRAPQRWRDWMARLAMSTGLHQLLGAQHAAYMRRVLAMFDEGRLEDALRHAVPLGSDDGQSLGQAFGRLGPRRDLSLQTPRIAAASISFGDSFEQHLRRLYRRTFEQLDAAGRVDEAAFVLAELLRARQEALDYLEKHGRLKQAAELAFGWDMPAVQIVRLHALAGEWRQAVLIARRDQVFAEAVTLLEKRWPEAAATLRREWAGTLVAQGRWLDAVRAIWPLEEDRSRAGEWLARAERAGGALAARALALRAQCQPETLASRTAFIEALRDDPALAAERAALAHELLRTKTPIEPAARRIAALVAGMTIADQAGPLPTLDAKTLQALTAFAGDAALSADLPAAGPTWPGAAPQPLAKCDSPAAWQAPPPGALPIFDAVPLADGEFLIALGEAGAARLDARGRRLARFDAPAHRLVISSDGRSALALAPRERVWRVTRLDLADGTTANLGLHLFDAFADHFDGIGWTTGTGTRVQVLDTTTGLRDALWQVTDLPGRVLAIDNTGTTERLILSGDGATPPELQQWTYDLPKRHLRSRDTLPTERTDADFARFQRILVQGVGLVDLEFSADPDDGTAHVSSAAAPHERWASIPGLGANLTAVGANGWLAVRSAGHPSEADGSVRLIEFASGQVRGRWHWPAAAGLGIRHAAGIWLVFDREGRLSALDVGTGVQRAFSVW